MIRVAGAIIACAGLVGALALPLVGLPGAFGLLLIAASLLWLVGVVTAAACLAPPRRVPGFAALAAGLLGWPLLLLYGLSPLWGALVAACGLMVAISRPAPGRSGPGRPGTAEVRTPDPR